MNERILNLLLLCMQAIDKGINISFDYGMLGVDVWHYNEYNKENYIPKLITHLSVPIQSDRADVYFDEIEKYLKGLIEWQAQD